MMSACPVGVEAGVEDALEDNQEVPCVPRTMLT